MRAALRISGTHRHRADGFLDYVIRIHAWAGKPYVAMRLSGDRDYILKGMRTLESILINMNFQLVVSPGGKKTVTVDSLPGGGR